MPRISHCECERQSRAARASLPGPAIPAGIPNVDQGVTMSQNRIALQWDVDRLNSLDAIITALEGQLTDLIGLSPD